MLLISQYCFNCIWIGNEQTKNSEERKILDATHEAAIQETTRAKERISATLAEVQRR